MLRQPVSGVCWFYQKILSPRCRRQPTASFLTAIKATLRYKDATGATDAAFHAIRGRSSRCLPITIRLSVQHTPYAIGETILDKFAEIEEIAFSRPNIHCLPVDIAKFGLENGNRIFVPTDEPHGLIEARLAR